MKTCSILLLVGLLLLYKYFYQHFIISYTAEPLELASLDPKYQEAYRTALKEGKRTVCQSRVMIVGHFGAGKSSLLRCLLNQPFVEEHIPTIGIETSKQTEISGDDLAAGVHIAKTSDWTQKGKKVIEIVSFSFSTAFQQLLAAT